MGAKKKRPPKNRPPKQPSLVARGDDFFGRIAKWSGGIAILGTICTWLIVHCRWWALLAILPFLVLWITRRLKANRILWTAIAIIICGFFWVKSWQRPIEPTDPLSPSNDPMPSFRGRPFAVDLPTNSFVFFFGGNVVVIRKAPYIPLITSAGRPYLWMTFSEKGAFISGRFMDKKNELVVKIDANKIMLNDGNRFNPKHPDRSTFVVSDLSDFEVLNIRYLNSSAFRLSGIIRSPVGEATITESNVVVQTAKQFSQMTGELHFGTGLLNFEETNIGLGTGPGLAPNP